MPSTAQYLWGTADELRFLARLAECNPLDRPHVLTRYARTLDLRHRWQNIDAWALRDALKEHGIDWAPPAGTTPRSAQHGQVEK